MQELQRKIEYILLKERLRWFLWVPVALGIGIWLHTNIQQQWAIYFVAFFMVVVLCGLYVAWHKFWLRQLLNILLFIMFGYLAMSWQSYRLQNVLLEESLPISNISGELVEIIDTEKAMKLIIANPEIENRNIDAIPNKIRISLKKPDYRLKIGQKISLRGGIFPLPDPALPGGFDFGRHFYFQGIGAVGFGLQPINIVEETAISGVEQWLAAKRRELATHIRSKIDNNYAAAVAAALVTGERSAIAQEVKDAMMAAGLAHMLAISGLHLGLVAGILFILTRRFLVLIPNLALHYDVKKWAAVISLIGSFCYLALAGFPVSAQRAYVMVALVLGAVIADRRVMPMRSLALAASIILIISPSAMFSPSFQLSFAATIAILTLVENFWPGKDTKPLHKNSLLYKPILYFTAVILTSLAASIATSPYVIYHFNQFTAWDIVGNLAASALLSMWVMPSAVIAVLLMPIGLDAPFFALMGQGVEFILAAAFWVSSLPYALNYVPAMPGWAIALVTFGGCWFCFWQTKWRWLGAIPILSGMLSLIWVEQPDIIVAKHAKQIAVKMPDNSGYVMVRGSKRNFNARLWQKALGIDNWQNVSALPNYHCDLLGCIIERYGYKISITNSPLSLDDDCVMADVIISDFYHNCDNDSNIAVERPELPISIMLQDSDIKLHIAQSFISKLR